MDSATLAGWIVALATIATLFFLIRHRGEDLNVTKMNDRLKPIEDALLRHDRYHTDHYDHAKAANISISGLTQNLKDHEKQDEERFGRIEIMHREIREDIKELLKR